MLVKFLKITSIFVLIGTFIVLIQKRDFITKHGEENTTAQHLALEQTTETTSTATVNENTQTSVNHALVTQEIAEATKTVAKIAEEVSKANPYIQQNEGVSDTDESYEPQASPCARPMEYKIGTFDSRFGISKESFITTINNAASLWEDTAGEKLFVYNPTGSLTINLIYDERQLNTEGINNLSEEIENSKEAAEQLKTAYEQEKVLYTSQAESLVKDAENFQIQYKAYNDKVATFNKQGGASKPEYDAMMSELATLQQEAKILDERRQQLLTATDSINKKVTRYNEFVVYINDLIKKSNSLGSKKFTEGKFMPSTNTIDIYQYDNTTKLFRVLAHELGHALGINHTTNRYSIMYSINSATTTVLSLEDKEALAQVCK